MKILEFIIFFSGLKGLKVSSQRRDSRGISLGGVSREGLKGRGVSKKGFKRTTRGVSSGCVKRVP